jgi:hypothetical protein
MTERRFTDKAVLDPSAIWALPETHAAMVENRTLFPSTVVNVDESYSGKLLISGRNNRKLGETIIKGRFAGYQLFGLSLEERATCSPKCEAKSFCYGNSMQMARRHRIADPEMFFIILEDEIRENLAGQEHGLMIRLHVLGDFPDVEYVGFWADMLAAHERLACYGYTHWTEGEIGKAIAGVKASYPDRFRIRWSSATPRADGAVVVDFIPDKPRIAQGIVCPAQTDATACCASCGTCWEKKTDTIVFIKHGKHSIEQAAAAARADTPGTETRPIAPIKIPAKPVPKEVSTEPPEVRLVYPTELRVEPAYQRDLSGKSVSLIRKIVAEWDWAKFKPPVCAETADGLFVIDGQHTAIAAASHPKAFKIPVLIVSAELVEKRADSFVSHNRDRITMTPFQILHAEAVAGGKEAVNILAIATRAGATVPRNPPQKGRTKPGEIACVSELRKIFRGAGPDVLDRVLRIAVLASCNPITTTVARSIRTCITAPSLKSCGALPDKKIADALHSIRDFDSVAEREAAEAGRTKYGVGALLISRAATGASDLGAAA